VALALVLGLWAIETRRGREPGEARVAHTAAVVRADFVRSIRLAGRMEALESYSVIAPVIRNAQSSSNSESTGGEMVLTELDPAGTRVKKGSPVAQFDPQPVIRDYISTKASYEGLLDQVAAKQADEAAARAKDDADLTQAEDALKKAQLEILKNPILSPNDVQTNQLNLKEAEATLKQEKLTYALKRQSAAADIRDFELQAEEKRQVMVQAQQNERMMTVRAPVDGIVVIDTHWAGDSMAPFEVGDSVRPGTPFMRIVNPSRMEVRINVNQLDAPYIKAGQRAVIHLDAYPGSSFPGVIESISPIGAASDFSQKLITLSATAFVEGNDPRLMPDLSAAVDAELQTVPDALIVPRDAILRQSGGACVLLKNATGFGFAKHPVKLGALNDTQAVVESGLRPGEIVERGVNKALPN
jgi:HlyD family secretion protein